MLMNKLGKKKIEMRKCIFKKHEGTTKAIRNAGFGAKLKVNEF
jgi:hypothetical protein